MALSCSPTDLANAAIVNGFNKLSPNMKGAVELYLLQQIAGLGASTTAEVVNAAKCFQCLSPNQMAAVRDYLLCQIVNK